MLTGRNKTSSFDGLDIYTYKISLPEVCENNIQSKPTDKAYLEIYISLVPAH